MSESHAELTATQQQTAQQLLNILAENLGQKLIVLLLGISGVGKTLLLNLLKSRITELGGNIVSACDLMHHDSQYPRQTITDAKGPLVCASTLHEQREILERAPKYLKKWRITELVLKGMGGPEIETYISRTMPEGMKLSLKQLACYSLGIPVLADDLLALNLNEEQAFRLSAKYFFQNTGWTCSLNDAKSLVAKFLNVPAPAEFFEGFPDKVLGISHYESRRIYDALYSFRMYQREDQKRNRKDDEESPDPDPLFVAPESEGIYDATLDSGNRTARMHIYVPSMTPEQATAVYKMLGYSYDHGYLQDHTYHNKLKWFGASYRKVSFYFRNQYHAQAVEHECDFMESLAELYHSNVMQGKYPPLSASDDSCRMLVETHDHNGLPQNPIRIGWGLETILQHHGVSYLVNNPMCNKLYIYDASIGHIVELGEVEEVSVSELRRSKSGGW